MKNSIYLGKFFIAFKLFTVSATLILYVHYFFPQSWGFFTIKPRQPLIDAYIIRNGIANKKTFFTNNMSYGMGMSRKGIVLFTALVKLIDRNKTLQWKPLNTDSTAYILQHEPFVIVKPGNGNHSYKGKFLFTKIERPPDTTLTNRGKFFISKQYILADVR